jgi:uncharacterized protein YdaU (DUF1376 family)
MCGGWFGAKGARKTLSCVRASGADVVPRVNYFELYPGDYLRDTGELSLCQHGAYLLMMASYYSTEDGLPADKVSLYRITRAMTKEEQSATVFVAGRFFFVGSDGRLHSARIDEDLIKARARIDSARANGSKGGRPPKPKANPEETQQKPSGFQSGSENDNRNGTQKKAHQTPDPITSVGSTEASTQRDVPFETGRACVLMKQAGCGHTNPGHIDLVAAISEGVTPETLRDTVTEAVGKGIGKPFTWAIATARARHAAGPTPVIAGHARAGPQQAEGKVMTLLRTLEGMKSGNQDRNELDSGRISGGLHAAGNPRLGGPAGS